MKKLVELLAKNPYDLVEEQDATDRDILRLALIAELDAISLYDQLAQRTTNEKLKEVLLDISKEEKTHVGELNSFLEDIDSEYKEELIAGDKEVKDIE